MYVVFCWNRHKDKKDSKKSANVEMTEAASIQGSPTYAATTQAFNGDTQTAPVLQYDYARTGPFKVRFLNNLHYIFIIKSLCTYICMY